MLNTKITLDLAGKFWDDNIVPALAEFIKIPCKTRTLDPSWQENGYLAQAANLAKEWIEKQNLPGTKVEVLSLPNQSPFVYAEIPGSDTSGKTALFYGHLDKMPEAEGWSEGLGPWQPVLRDDCLYGRGAIDDGYAIFTPIAAIKALQQQQLPYPRCIVLLESSEESGSPDFMDYFKQLESLIGNPDIIVFVDASGDNNNQLWCTTSLRGNMDGTLRVEMFTKGVHSGSSGIALSPFHILRTLLARIDNSETGGVLLKECYVDIPEERKKEARDLAKILGEKVYKDIPFIAGAKPVSDDIAELLLNKTWRPTLTIIGAEGLPPLCDAGSVLLPVISLQLSFRVPPGCNITNLISKVKEVVETDPPYGAIVTFTPIAELPGWSAPKTAPWLKEALDSASNNYFGSSPAYMGDGGSIGIVEVLGKKYPNAQFVVTGVANPTSGEHGPNEFIHIPTAKKFTCCIAEILATLSKPQ